MQSEIGLRTQPGENLRASITRVWRNASLQNKFLWVSVPLIALSTLVFFSVVHTNANNASLVELERRLDKISEIQAASISKPLWEFNTPQINSVITAMTNDPDIIGVKVYDDLGNVATSTGVLEETSDDVLSLEAPITLEQSGSVEAQTIGKLHLVYSKKRYSDEARERLRTSLILISLLTLSVLGSALIALQFAIRAPLNEFLGEIRRAEEQGTHEPIEWYHRDEIGTVVHAYNDLQASQQEYEGELHAIQNELEQRVEERTADLREREQELVKARDNSEAALQSLRKAQASLVQSEKLASLGQLTAGIAHEIKNPLNFINNFSKISRELIDELFEEMEELLANADEDDRESIAELSDMLKGNLQKINDHGLRADSIVKNMLAHSREGPGTPTFVNINSLAEEALDLVYHGARAETPGFNITIEKDLADDLPQVECLSQDIMRVFINIMNNGMYEADKRHREGGSGEEPRIELRTSKVGENVRIDMRDNGQGISSEQLEKIFNPFYTTKPAGKGTGLGLSLSFDIVVAQHGGELLAESEVGDYTQFSVILPIKMNQQLGDQE